MKNMLKLGLILAAYSVVACVGLALVNNATAPAIAAAQSAQLNQGLGELFPEATAFDEATDFAADPAQTIKIDKLYIAKKGDTVAGAIVQATGPTYDKATMLIGIDMDRKITGARFLALSDTPGFGAEANNPAFYGQFAGKSIDDSFTPGSDIDGLSGATITTKGVMNIVKYATYVAGEYLASHYGAAAGTGSAPVVAAPAEPFTFDGALSSIYPAEEYPDVTYEDITGAFASTVDPSLLFLREELVKSDGRTVGIVIEVKGPTYKSATVAVAVGLDRKIQGLRIIELNDTKQFGGRALEKEFWEQFAGKSVDDPMYVPSEGGMIREKGTGNLIDDPKTSVSDVDALSGATITSAGIANMVKAAGYQGAAYLAEHEGGAPAPAGSEDFALNEVYPEE